jgi:hypothetical protein
MRSAPIVASWSIALRLAVVVRVVVQAVAWCECACAAVVPRRRGSNAAATGSGRLNYSLRMYLEPKEEFKQIFNEGWRNQRDYLYVPNMHGADWPKMREMYGQSVCLTRCIAPISITCMDMMGAEIAIGHSYVRGGDMPNVPQPVAVCSALTSRSRMVVTKSRASTTTRVGIPICVRRSRRPAQTSTPAITFSLSTAST